MSLDHLPKRELEQLSAYIDGELSPREAQKLQARLEREPGLQRALDELQLVVQSMRGLPQARLPRSFTLSPDMVGVTRKRGGYPLLRLATALAAFAFVAVVGVDLVSRTFTGALPSRSAEQVAMEAPALAEDEMLGAAKMEAVETDAVMGAAPAEMTGEVALPEEEAEGEAFAMAAEAEPAKEEAAIEEGMVDEQERAVEPQLAAPEVPAPGQEEALPTISAEEAPEADTMVNQLELEEAPTPEFFAQPEASRGLSIFWIRGIEMGLAALTLLLGALTLWARKSPK
jgi:anti-sigma factor RsiW